VPRPSPPLLQQTVHCAAKCFCALPVSSPAPRADALTPPLPPPHTHLQADQHKQTAILSETRASIQGAAEHLEALVAKDARDTAMFAQASFKKARFCITGWGCKRGIYILSASLGKRKCVWFACLTLQCRNCPPAAHVTLLACASARWRPAWTPSTPRWTSARVSGALYTCVVVADLHAPSKQAASQSKQQVHGASAIRAPGIACGHAHTALHPPHPTEAYQADMHALWEEYNEQFHQVCTPVA